MRNEMIQTLRESNEKQGKRGLMGPSGALPNARALRTALFDQR
ncbi:hypothetical protein [Paraburkholderia franconis]|nr:hypothetical protein [Paraburkholderia franconis]